MAETWREMSFEPVPASDEPSRSARRLRGWLAGALLAASVVVYFFSRDRVVYRCHQECYGAAPHDGYGSLTYEPGHGWTHYADSWQWSVQHGLTQFAIVAGLVGLALATTSRRGVVPALVAAAVALTAWIVWVLLSPSIP